MTTDVIDDELAAPIREFGERLRGLRLRLGYTQPELASKLRCKRQTIASWEQGQTTPDVKTLLHLQNVAQGHEHDPLAISLSELLGEVRIDFRETPLHFGIQLLQRIDAMGIRGVYPNRTQALTSFSPFLEKELTSICIVSSSFFGVTRVATEKIAALFSRKAAEVQEFKILMTHPEISCWRETQEGRAAGSIGQEIRESAMTLLRWGVKKENIRFYKGAPTIFLVFTPDRMLANPYTFQTEAFKTVTFELAPTGSEDDIYSQYFVHHFKRPWESKSSVPFSELEKQMNSWQSDQSVVLDKPPKKTTGSSVKVAG